MVQTRSLITTFSSTGYIKSIELDGAQIAENWGVETSDPWGFFTSVETSQNCEITRETNTESSKSNSKYDLKMGRSELEISTSDSINGMSITRTQELTMKSSGLIADFVTRYKFSKASFPKARIAGNEYQHRDSRLNYMFPVETAQLVGDEWTVDVSCNQTDGAGSMGVNMYVSDQRENWVIHIRQLPITPDREVVRLCKNWYDSQPLPNWMSATLIRIPWFKRRFWYGAESQKPRHIWHYFNPGVFPYASLNTGDRLAISSTCQFSLSLPEQNLPNS